MAPYRMCFGTEKIEFNALQAAIELRSSWLDQAPLNADPQLYRFLKRTAERIASERVEAFADKVRRALPALVTSGRVTAPVLARELGIEPRMLARRLAEEDCDLATLVRDARRETARQLVEGTRLPLTEIAASLHFSDASAFARAFRRDFGASPRKWRQDNRRS